MDSSLSTGDFVQAMMSCQSRLYAFVLSLLGDPELANDVLQETNVVLWEKADQFEPGTNFTAWAFAIARFQVMAQRQRLGRDRLVLDDEAVAGVAATFEERTDEMDDRMAALFHCLDELPEEGFDLIQQRYNNGLTVKTIAAELGQTANRVAVRLHRLRVALMECIQKHQAEGEPG